jgi:hypothetical protein
LCARYPAPSQQNFGVNDTPSSLYCDHPFFQRTE